MRYAFITLEEAKEKFNSNPFSFNKSIISFEIMPQRQVQKYAEWYYTETFVKPEESQGRILTQGVMKKLIKDEKKAQRKKELETKHWLRK